MKKAVLLKDAPAPVGPYSQAVEACGFVFVSGQIPLKPDGSAVYGDFSRQAKQVFENLKAVLEASGLGLESAVKVTAYLADMGDYARFNAAYAKYFKAPYPARAVVQVAALPKGARMEVELVAARQRS